MSLSAYQRARAVAEQPRQTEHRLMTEITREMIEARSVGASALVLMPALHRNREVWSAFSAVCGATGNQLPDGLRAGIISLALWVDRHTSDVAGGRESIDQLIDVNLAVIDGLSANNIAH